MFACVRNVRHSFRIMKATFCRTYHTGDGMLGVNKNDMELYKSAYRDHPLRHRTDIPDDLHLWSISQRYNPVAKILNARDIPTISDVQNSIPLLHKSEIAVPKVRYPLHSTYKSMKTLYKHSRNWMLKYIGLHIGTITEIEADAVVIGTDSSMRSLQLSSSHVYRTSEERISDSTRSRPSILGCSPSTSSDVVFPVGTVRVTNGLLNCASSVALLTVQPRRSSEVEYKSCIRNIFRLVIENQYQTLVLPVLGMASFDVQPYSAMRWTLEGVYEFLKEHRKLIQMPKIPTDNNKEPNQQNSFPSSPFRVILIIESAKHWRQANELIKIVLCDDNSPLISIKPKNLNLRYSKEKHRDMIATIPTGTEALRIVRAKEKRSRDIRRGSFAQKAKSGKGKILNGGGRLRNCGEYKAIKQPKIIRRD